MTDSSPAIHGASQEIVLDGVRYAMLHSGGLNWRLASLIATWREELAALDLRPDKTALSQLAQKGVWLAPCQNPKPLAVMCAGLGACWPGMGRELYANFPAARQAMDEIADLADWDTLALLDETDAEKINRSLLQIPYLFMLEYAQWRQLASLGLKPSLFCGHSIGELVALCLAGVYSLDCAWHLFETRAFHMASLEVNSKGQTGMLGISADISVIKQTLAEWPALSISNINTPTQYVLSGSKKDLLAARKSLRQNRIPAFMLNINMAFHNPAMRVLRDLSYRRLNALDIHAPLTPMLSCVTAGLYPDVPELICGYITDLDENTVDWVKSVQAMTGKYGISQFVELGPRETVCGLTKELAPQSECLAADKKDREILAIRELCARLFVSGHLSWEHISLQKNIRNTQIWRPAVPEPVKDKNTDTAPLPEDTHIVLQLLAEVSGKKLSEIGMDQDLRYDLALRSSSFPYLVQEAERRMQRSIPLENMFQIATVGDLVRFFGAEVQQPSPNEASADEDYKRVLSRHASLGRYYPLNGEFVHSRLDPACQGIRLREKDIVVLAVFDDELLPQIWTGLVPIPCALAIPEHLLEKCQSLGRGGNRLIPLDCGLFPSPEELGDVLEQFEKKNGKIAGILFIPPPVSPEKRPQWEIISYLEAASVHVSWRLCLQRFLLPELERQDALHQGIHDFLALRGSLSDCSSVTKFVAFLDNRMTGLPRNQDELGTMLALELFYGERPDILWRMETRGIPFYCPASDFFREVYPGEDTPSGANLFPGRCQFSSFSEPMYVSHGNNGYLPFERDVSPGPWLPFGDLLVSLLAAARMATPWLELRGLADLHVFQAPSLPPGITRECRLVAHGRNSIPQDGALTKLCRVEMSCRQLGVNKRHTGSWLPLADAVCLLGCLDLPPPLWNLADCRGLKEKEIPARELEEFYDFLGMGSDWRLIRQMGQIAPCATFPEVPVYQALLEASKNCIATERVWGYKNFMIIAEGLLQAALLALALDNQGIQDKESHFSGSRLEKWRFRSAGFMRFDLSSAGAADVLKFQLRRSWLDDSLCRFDAQVINLMGKVILTLNHLEFFCINTLPRDDHSAPEV